MARIGAVIHQAEAMISNHYWLFYVSCLGFVIAYGYCRKWMIEANRAATKAKARHEEFNY